MAIRRIARPISWLALALTPFVGSVGCKPRTPIPVLTAPDGTKLASPERPNEEDEVNARRLLEEARTLDAAGRTKDAESKRTEVIAGFPATGAAAEIFYERATASEKAGAVATAIEQYEKLLFYRPSFERADSVKLI